MFQQARDGVYKLDAQHGRTPDAQSDQFAGSLTASAVTQGLTRIDQVALNGDASRAYAVQGDVNSPFKQVAEVNTQQAIATPLEKSSETIQQQATQQAQVQQVPLAEQQSQQRQGPSPNGP
jgi:putative chitinase